MLNPSDWTDNVVYDYLKRHPESFYKIPLDKRTPKNFVYAILKEIWQCGVLYPQERTGQKQDLSEYIQNQLNKMSEGININDYFMDVLKESSIYPDELNILKEIFIELKLIDPKSIKEESVEDKTQINEIVSDLRRFHILDLDDYLPEYRKKIISRYPSILNVA